MPLLSDSASPTTFVTSLQVFSWAIRVWARAQIGFFFRLHYSSLNFQNCFPLAGLLQITTSATATRHRTKEMIAYLFDLT